MNGATHLNRHFSHLCHYLFCEIYMIDRSNEYHINDERIVCPICYKGISDVIEGANSKTFSPAENMSTL